MKTYPYPDSRPHQRHVRPLNKKLILFILFILLAILSFATPATKDTFYTKYSSGKAILNWTLETEAQYSYYIIERSADGITFSEVTMIFSTGENHPGDYAYSENVSNLPGGSVYYRLKIADNNGSCKYSEVRSVSTGNSVTAARPFPKPYQSRLRITVPVKSTSQKEPVTYVMRLS